MRCPSTLNLAAGRWIGRDSATFVECLLLAGVAGVAGELGRQFALARGRAEQLRLFGVAAGAAERVDCHDRRIAARRRIVWTTGAGMDRPKTLNRGCGQAIVGGSMSV